ncbi:MAG: YihY/virulence factor BrkB family protein [Paenibacillaceae bacterium]|jgi:membrane protein|nr:YihY/virulence factor BrkB family protein [Paenibacillaceae bacterium]
MRWKKQLTFLEDLYCRFEDDEVTALGAQMTYYFILAFFPFLIFLLTLMGNTPLSDEEVWSNLALVLPMETYTIISDIIRQIIEERNDALLSFGMIATLWAASNGLSAIIKGLNKAYDEPETRPWWKLKGLAVIFTLAIALVMIISFALLVFGKVIGEQLFEYLAYPAFFETVWGVVKLFVPIGAMLLIFILLFMIVPNRRLRMKNVLPGAAFVTIGWIVISFLFSFYVNNFGNYAKSYGSIGGVIVLLIWLYLSSIIILLGGEINATLAFSKDGQKKPACKSFSSRLAFLRRKTK